MKEILTRRQTQNNFIIMTRNNVRQFHTVHGVYAQTYAHIEGND